MLRSSRGKETAQNKRKVDQTRFAFSGATAAICGTFAAIASIPTIPDPGGTLLASSMVQPRPSDGPPFLDCAKLLWQYFATRVC
jgi:hypothetical protein